MSTSRSLYLDNSILFPTLKNRILVASESVLFCIGQRNNFVCLNNVFFSFLKEKTTQLKTYEVD